MRVFKQKWRYYRPSAAVCVHITVDFHWSQLAVWQSNVYLVDAAWFFIAHREKLVTVSRLTRRITRALRRCTTLKTRHWLESTKGAFTATQLNWTQLDVELSSVELRRYKRAFRPILARSRSHRSTISVIFATCRNFWSSMPSFSALSTDLPR